MIQIKPEMCPYCGEKRLEELQPTEVVIDDTLWTIHHYECQFCTEVFDKIITEGQVQFDLFSEELGSGSDEDDSEEKFSH
ncbi:MAG: hypothetical protein C0603_03510 [Denitrovibrio sp.]|nr:MAG: hypothetical protein C0603_03510 [Denitrovibrio sp.]